MKNTIRGRKKLNHEKSMGFTAAHEYEYIDEFYTVIINADYPVISKSKEQDRKTLIAVKRLIQNWLDITGIDRTDHWEKWVNPIRRLVDLYDIPPDKRKELFDQYRQTIIVKLDQAIKGCYQIQETEPYQSLNEIFQTNLNKIKDVEIDDRIRQAIDIYTDLILPKIRELNFRSSILIEAYKEHKNWLENQYTGSIKFVYYYLKILSSRIPQSKRISAITELYRLGKFDDFHKISRDAAKGRVKAYLNESSL